MGVLETCLSRLRQAALHMQQSPQEDDWPRAYVKDGVLVQGGQEGAEVRLPVHSQLLPNSACQVSHLPVRGRMYGWERMGSERCGGSLTSRKGGEQGWELSGRCQADIVVYDDRRIGEVVVGRDDRRDGDGLDIQSEAALVSTFRLPAPFWNVAAAQAVRQQQFCQAHHCCGLHSGRSDKVRVASTSALQQECSELFSVVHAFEESVAESFACGRSQLRRSA